MLAFIKKYGRAPLAPEHRFFSVLLALAVLRVVMVIGLMLGVGNLSGRVPPWYFHTGGDQHQFYAVVESFFAGHSTAERVGFGAPLMMIPFAWLLDAARYRDVVAPMVVINGMLAGGVSAMLVGQLGRDLTGEKRVGLLAAAGWTLLPIAVYLLLGLHPSAELLRGSMIPKLMWLNGISDGPATFAFVAGTWAVGRFLVTQDMRWVFVGGFAFGWAVMARVIFGLDVAIVLAIVALSKLWRVLAWLAVGGLTGYLPQAIFNLFEYGFPFYTGYLRVTSAYTPGTIEARRPFAELIRSIPLHPTALVSSVAHFAGRYWFITPLIVILVGGLVAVLLLFWRRRGFVAAALLVGIPAGHIVVALATTVFATDPVRFSMLAYPYVLAVGGYLLFDLWDAARARLNRRPPPEVPPQAAHR